MVAVRTSHVFEFARKRAEQFAGVTPVKSALFSEDWVGFGIARLYESLMKETPIDARAFRDRATAAVWLGVPAEILKLEDRSAPPALGVISGRQNKFSASKLVPTVSLTNILLIVGLGRRHGTKVLLRIWGFLL